MKKRVEWEAPIGKDGALMAYPDEFFSRGGITYVSRDSEWVLNLTFDSFSKGFRSAYRFRGRDQMNRKWPMSISQFI